MSNTSQNPMQTPSRPSSNRGFAAMDRARQRAIASAGGRAAHAKGTAHEFTSDEARDAGRKGGEAVSQNREHMAAIGRIGGRNSHGSSRSRTTQSVRAEAGGGAPSSAPMDRENNL
ncbi:MAG TPA: KGG domain-containing protein [Burkholderiaceae bacterium]|jgi:general stress protein YciG|uniref:KGG domain-containing protein n=1 Tax=Imbroritus primus TaxID=3058603 RepID=UPI0002696AA6|nr:KGG domain-containing protein [Burkholderiaceae bacterium]